MADLKELANKFKDQAGGMYEIGDQLADGDRRRDHSAPRTRIDVWPPQWRIDDHRPGQRRQASSRPGTS